jgi:beta-galactosidase
MIVYQSEAVTNELGAPYFGMDRDKMVGLAYWGAIEYWGESLAFPSKGWNYSFFTHSLEPNPQAYLIKSIFKENEPLVHIGIVDSEAESQVWNDVVVGRKYISSHWNREAGKKYDLYTYTNAAEVELLVNGKSIGVQKNNTETSKRNVIFWKGVDYSAGKIVAIARNSSGKEVARHELETTGEAVALKIETENADWKADGMDLQYVKVYAVDKEGRVVPTFKGEATFEISGEAKLIAVDNGDHSSDELFSGTKRTMYRGFAMAILRAKQTPGKANVEVSVKGLKAAEKTLQTTLPK